MFGFMNFQSSISLYLKNKLKNSSSFRNSSRLERNFFSNELIFKICALDNKQINDIHFTLEKRKHKIIKVGKRKFLKIV